MENLESLEKAINSELTTKILSSNIKHDQINILIEDNNLSTNTPTDKAWKKKSNFLNKRKIENLAG